jgi:endoglucanase
MSIPPIPRILAALTCLSLIVGPVSAQTAGPALIPNSDFSSDSKGAGWPDGWGKGDGITWETESGAHFLRLTSQRPGQMLMLYREISIPAGVKAAELTVRYRSAGIKKGEKPWFDARVIVNFMDAARKAVKPDASPLVLKPEAAEWTTVTKRFVIPEGAQKIKFMPSLFQVAEGRVDFAEIKLVGIDPASVQ